MTEWRTIPSIPNYSASSGGDIRNDLTGTLRKSSAGGKMRYRGVGFSVGGRRIFRNVHVLVAEAFHGPRPKGMQTRHIDGNPANCAADNLAYGTARDNAADRDTHGNTCRGDKNGNRIVSSDEVTAMRLQYAAGGVTQYELADSYGISQAQVNNIILRKQWAALEGGAQ